MRKLLALMALSPLGFAAKPGLTSDTVWEMRSVADPQITRDGARVVYVLGWNDKMVDQKYSNLWIVSADGKDNRRLPAGPFAAPSPRLPPGAPRLAYLSNR